MPSLTGRSVLFVLIIFVSVILVQIWKSNSFSHLSPPSLGIWQHASQAQVATETPVKASISIDVQWYPPNKTAINDISSVVNGTGVYGIVFENRSIASNGSDRAYNFCNAHRVRAQEYVRPSEEYMLEYVEVIQRHHKRTPYAANAFPHESYSWFCDDEALFYFGAPRGQISGETQRSHVDWQVYTDTLVHPFQATGFAGTCQFPQITAGGLLDSRQHGKDLRGVYRDLLHFLPDNLTFFATPRSSASSHSSPAVFRVTNNQITSQVLSQVLVGLYPSLDHVDVKALVQPSSIDSLEPRYPCPAANAVFSSYGVGSSNTEWLAHLSPANSGALFRKIDSISEIPADDAEWHSWFDHYFDNLSARLCHAKPLPCKHKATGNTDSSGNSDEGSDDGGDQGNSNDDDDDDDDKDDRCITIADANAVFRRGMYEYSFIYRDSPLSLAASAASFGVWMAELASHLRTRVQQVSAPVSMLADPVNPDIPPGSEQNEDETEDTNGNRNSDMHVRYRHNVAHDGSLARLLSILQVSVMTWPALGSEVVFELYSRSTSTNMRRYTSSSSSSSSSSASSIRHIDDTDEAGQAAKSTYKTTGDKTFFIRVLWSGQPLHSSHPDLGLLDMVPVTRLLRYIDDLVGVGAVKVPEMCQVVSP